MSLGALFGWEVVLTALFLLTIFSATRDDAPPGIAGLAIGGILGWALYKLVYVEQAEGTG